MRLLKWETIEYW